MTVYYSGYLNEPEKTMCVSTWRRYEVKFLGVIVNATGVRIDPGGITVINEFPRPTNQKAVQRFLGSPILKQFYAIQSAICESSSLFIYFFENRLTLLKKTKRTDVEITPCNPFNCQ